MVITERQTSSKSKLPPPPMSSQTSSGEAVPPPRANQKTILDDVILTFSSPMAWLLMVALIITWAAVAVVLFDLLDYKTLAAPRRCWQLVWSVVMRRHFSGPEITKSRKLLFQNHSTMFSATIKRLPPPPAIARRGLKANRGGVRPTRCRPSEVANPPPLPQESTDWMEIMWTFAASLVAPDEEEEAEGIHQLTETFTSLHSEEF